MMHGHHILQSMHQPGKVANPARGQLNREDGHFPVPVIFAGEDNGATKWRELVSSGRLVCRRHAIFLWCYV